MTGKNGLSTERRRVMRYRIAVAVLCLGVFIGAFAAIRAHEDRLDSSGIVMVAIVVGIMLALAGICGMFAFRSDDAERTAGEPGSYRDRIQRGWVSNLTILPAATLGLTVIAMTRAEEWLSGEDTSWSGLMLAGVAVLNILLIPLMLMGWDGGSRKIKRLLDDELTRAYRASAITCAFWVLLVGVTGVYLLGLWNADAAVIAMPMILWLAAGTAALRFAQLHRRAERDMGDDG
ncbi:MAG: hypothetical protein EON88_11815 [Brevundimonas sp.]|nr:MAG: hypothetical protein EON88_11815 [Brevundimonas sp.]